MNSDILPAVKRLKAFLVFKIIFTFFPWSLPLLAFSSHLLNRLGFPRLASDGEVFRRLLGAAYVALLVGYILGLRDLRNGRQIENTVTVGIWSNGFAFVILTYFGCIGTWSAWGVLASS